MFFGRRFTGYHRGALSGLDILVLSIIKNKGKISGYAIIQKLNKQFRGMGSTSAGTIYPLLSRLEKKGLVKKRVYFITDKGVDKL